MLRIKILINKNCTNKDFFSVVTIYIILYYCIFSVFELLLHNIS